MTHFTERHLTQKCIYWGSPTSDGYGSYTYADPVELDCRWEDVRMVETDTLTVQFQIRSEVQLAQDVIEEGMLLLGSIDDLDSDEFNDPVSAGADKIVRFDKIPTMHGDHFYRKAYIGRLWTGKA
jgi:hypothetical protein